MVRAYWILVAFLINFTTTALVSNPAHADYQQRFSLGAGVWHMNNPSQTDFTLGGEYEYRLDPMLGLGGGLNYIFANPGIWLVPAPELFLHPFASEFYVSAAPLFEFGPGVSSTQYGVQLETRVPLPLGDFKLVPLVGVDLISGGPNWIIGLGFEF